MRYEKARVTKLVGGETFLMKLDLKSEVAPGQFFMVRIPYVGEKPFSPCNDEPLEFLIKVRGRFTENLRKLRIGEKVWIRGPYGNGFNDSKLGKRVIVVAGGTGVSPATLLARKHRVEWFFYGVGSKEEILVKEVLEKFSNNLYISTEDGSFGEKGLVTDLLERKLGDIKPTSAVVCGPEVMMKRACEILKKVLPPSRIFLSIERYVKCAIGLCGSCDFGGYRVCVDGPVFSYEKICEEIPDFGKFKRDECGKRVPI